MAGGFIAHYYAEQMNFLWNIPTEGLPKIL